MLPTSLGERLLTAFVEPTGLPSKKTLPFKGTLEGRRKLKVTFVSGIIRGYEANLHEDSFSPCASARCR